MITNNSFDYHRLSWIGIALFICLIPLAIWHTKWFKQQALNEYKIFYKADINGVIKNVQIKRKQPAFTLQNDSIEYSFFPNMDKHLNKNNNFTYTAEKGDTVIKPAFSDTLLLIKGKQVLKYTFYKFDK